MQEERLQIEDEDSSDEEDSNAKSRAYNLKARYSEFMASRNVPAYIREADPQGYSFLSYAIGVKKIYSPEVSAIYYPKKRALGRAIISSSKDDINKWLTHIIQDSVYNIFLIEAQRSLTVILYHQFIEQRKSEIANVHSVFLGKLQYVFKQTHSQFILGQLEEAVSNLENTLIRFIEAITDPVNFEPAESFAATDLAQSILIQNAVLPNYNRELQWLRDKCFLTQNNNFVGIDARRNILRKYQAKNRYEQQLLHIVSTVASASKDPTILLNENRFTIVTAFIEDYINQEKTNQNKVLSDTFQLPRTGGMKYYFKDRAEFSQSFLQWLWNADQNYLLKYIPYDLVRLKAELLSKARTQLRSLLIHFLMERRAGLKIKLSRALPRQQVEFCSNNPIELLANLRLSHRIQRRRIRQAQDDEERKQIQGEIFSACWYFKDTAIGAMEKQEITSNAGRSDLVMNMDNYSTVFTELQSHIHDANVALHYLRITDKTIALWIRSIIRSGELVVVDDFDPKTIPSRQQKLLFKFLINFIYLILGCETQRNPGGLISQQVILDLILDERTSLSWKDTLANPNGEKSFGGGYLPMSMGTYKDEATNKNMKTHTVKCARVLQRHYGLFAVRHYSYEGEAASESTSTKEYGQIKELIRRENIILTSWFETKGYAAKTMDEKIDLLEQSTRTWYGLPP